MASVSIPQRTGHPQTTSFLFDILTHRLHTTQFVFISFENFIFSYKKKKTRKKENNKFQSVKQYKTIYSVSLGQLQQSKDF